MGDDPIVVDDISKVGLPWICCHDAYGFRFDVDVFPFPGLGGFIGCVQHQCLVVMWPMNATLDAGAAIETVNAFLSKMTPTEAGKFMNGNATHVVIKTNDLVWRPYGYHCFIVGIEKGSACFYQPLLSKQLLRGSDLPNAVLQSVCDVNVSFVQANMAARPWQRIGNTFLSWLQGCFD